VNRLTKALGLIPARGGSKRIPRKVMRILAGKPLLEYTVESARKSQRLARVILSTDDAEIAELGCRLGVEVPFMRPANLAADTTPMLAAVQHALTALEAEGEQFDAICLLQPTAPLRTAHQIDACIDLLDDTGADAVVTMIPIPPEYHPDWAYRRRSDGAVGLWNGARDPAARGQDLSPAFCRSGDVYVTRREVIQERNSLYGDRVIGYPVDPACTVNLDDYDDWIRAEAILSRSFRSFSEGDPSRLGMQ
jgi:CMP-N,N'-diacetyllegionaminic acid synthase